jgi:hypothetical protein
MEIYSSIDSVNIINDLEDLIWLRQVIMILILPMAKYQ